jgi:hypothetical protein
VAFIAPVENLSRRVIVLASPSFALFRCHNVTSFKYVPVPTHSDHRFPSKMATHSEDGEATVNSSPSSDK